jgi:peptide/nickel transport system ATP-binding protein
VALLSVDNLSVSFVTRNGTNKAVDNVSFSVEERQITAIIGESGSGKSVSCYAMLGLVPSPPGRIDGGTARFQGQDLLALSEAELRAIRGRDIAMIFQDPMTCLNPFMKIGDQLIEPLTLHKGLAKGPARERAMALLDEVGIRDPQAAMSAFPHEFSGGMRQRVMIAMALSCNPKILIADEPTTALYVTIQAQILDLIVELKEKLGTAVILITHDLGVVAETTQRVVVMYAGRKVEEGSVIEIFEQPLHPYTQGLLSSIPSLSIMAGGDGAVEERLTEIPGMVPALNDLPEGCAFAPRCPFADGQCTAHYPPYEEKQAGHWAACWHSEKLQGAKNV